MALLGHLKYVLGCDTHELARQMEDVIGPTPGVKSEPGSPRDALDDAIANFDFRAGLRELNRKDSAGDCEAISSSHFVATSPLSDSSRLMNSKHFPGATSPSFSR